MKCEKADIRPYLTSKSFAYDGVSVQSFEPESPGISLIMARDRPVNDKPQEANRLIQLARRGGFSTYTPRISRMPAGFYPAQTTRGYRHLPLSIVYSNQGFRLTSERGLSCQLTKSDATDTCFRPGPKRERLPAAPIVPQVVRCETSPGWRGWRSLTEYCGCFFL
jgi:hypothetical protein